MKSNYSIGIDVGKEELVTCIRSSDGLTESPISFPNSSIGLKRLLRYLDKSNIKKDTPILLESTGPHHWKAAHTLTQHNYLAKVANPLHTKNILKHSIRKRKTDKVDSEHLAFLASQNYGYVFKETTKEAKRKTLIRHYWKLKTTATNHLVHERYMKEYRSISSFGISSHISKKCEKIKEVVIKEYSKGNDLKYLTSIPGISPFLACCLLAELTPLDKFNKLEQIVAYTGLDPSVKQSGGKVPKYGRLSKRGSVVLRRVLYLAAFGAFASKTFKPFYQYHKDRGLHHTVVLCIIARKILRISVTLLKKRRMFDEKFIQIPTEV